MKQIKFIDVWVAKTSSNIEDNKVYKTKGFKTLFKKDYYYNAEETFLILNDKQELTPVSKFNDDLQVFNSEQEANQHVNERKQYWLSWFIKERDNYAEKVKQYQ